MTTHHNTETDYDEEDAPRDRSNGRNAWTQFIGHFWRGSDEEEEVEDEAPAPSGGTASIPAPSRSTGGSYAPMRRNTNGAPLRLETVRRTYVTVRRTVQNFEDIRRAMDGLREGIQQIVNLEQTPADMAERLIDFMNGGTYAIDGSVEKIGEQVYLFTPPSVIVDIDDKSKTAGSRLSFLDKE